MEEIKDSVCCPTHAAAKIAALKREVAILETAVAARDAEIDARFLEELDALAQQRERRVYRVTIEEDSE